MKTLVLRFALWTGLLLIASCTPWSMFLGSSAHVIGAWAVIVPLLGALLPLTLSSSILMALAFGRLVTIGLPLALGIPTMIAALSWAISTNKENSNTTWVIDTLLHAALPLTCILLFVTHPTGQHASLYACYWLIPLTLWALRIAKLTTNNTWLNSTINALQSTFVAHAVGGIIWLYAVPMTAAQWLCLVPVVAVERLLIAGISVIALQAIVTAATKVTTTTSRTATQNR
jgi:hypothetical protein